MLIRAYRALVRSGFHQFYNRFAFTYDWVSHIVSRGDWRAWTRAAIPFVRGSRVLEIAFGTGDLHLDLHDAGYEPVGVDLSRFMHDITRKKFLHRSLSPRLVRASVRQLPFPDAHFSTLIMTFPPGFVYDRAAMGEMARVLEPNGVLLWVDAPYLYPRDLWGRLLNHAFRLTGGCADPNAAQVLQEMRRVDGGALLNEWTWRAETVECARSRIQVFIGTKREGH